MSINFKPSNEKTYDAMCLPMFRCGRPATTMCNILLNSDARDNAIKKGWMLLSKAFLDKL